MKSSLIRFLVFDKDDITATLIESYLKGAKFPYKLDKYIEFDKDLIHDDIYYKYIFVDIGKADKVILEKIKLLSDDNKNIFITMSSDLSTDIYVKSLRAGAKEFLRKPIEKKDFYRIVKSNYKKEMLSPVENNNSKLIGVTSFEKSSGKTFFAVNLAKELADLTKEKVLLIDYNNNLNNITFLLDIDQQRDTEYFINNVTKDNYEKLFSKVYKYKDSSLYVMSNLMYKVNTGKSLLGDNIQLFFELIKKYYKYIVVDSNPDMELTNRILFSNTDLIFYVISTSLNANERNKTILDINYAKKKLKIILNKYRIKDEPKISQIEKILEREIFYKIPMNLTVTMGSSGKGRTVREINPKLDVVQSFNKLAGYVINRV